MRCSSCGRPLGKQGPTRSRRAVCKKCATRQTLVLVFVLGAVAVLVPLLWLLVSRTNPPR